MNFDEYTRLEIRSEYSNFRVRCYQASYYNSFLMSAIITGPQEHCTGVLANLVQGACVVSVDDKLVNRSEARYRRLVAPIKPAALRWVGMLILCKDPSLIWQDDDDGLIAGLKRITDTPFLDSWIGYIREQLVEAKLLSKLIGPNARGSYLTCTTSDLDDIVSSGVRTGKLVLA